MTKKNKALSKGKEEGEENQSKAPHSFIIHKGKVGKCVQMLQKDFRKVMEPNTAVKLKVISLILVDFKMIIIFIFWFYVNS